MQATNRTSVLPQPSIAKGGVESDSYRIVRPGQKVKLKFRPQRMRIVATLEMPVQDDDGTYVVVMHPDYAGSDLMDSNGLKLPAEPGEWTPPYISYDVPDGSHSSRFSKDTGQLVKRFEEVVSEEEIVRDMRRYANRLGLSCTDFEPLGDDFYEFRYSFRTPTEFRGYKIKRYLGRVEEDDLPNIADHEMRKGFAFLPIDERFYDLKQRQCERHRRPERLFMGKPIASNLRTVLDEQGGRETLCAQAVDMPSGLLSTDYEGFVFAGDLAGYGRFCKFLSENTGNLKTSGAAGAQDFRDLAIRLFTRLFHSADIRHVHTAGDGFICALPASELPSVDDQLEQALHAYLDMTTRLDEINDAAALLAAERGLESPPRLGSRLAIHHGGYRFGKMSLLASLISTLDGASIIEAARIEAGLRNWIYAARDTDRHWIAVSDEAFAKFGSLQATALEDLGPFKNEQGVDLKEKEFTGSVAVWQVDRPPA